MRVEQGVIRVISSDTQQAQSDVRFYSPRGSIVRLIIRDPLSTCSVSGYKVGSYRATDQKPRTVLAWRTRS
jgi:hypothetical protein